MQVEVTDKPTERQSQRMCAGCGGREEPEALVRLVVGPSAPYVAVDLGRKLGGRGVSVHPRRVCISQALKRGSLSRALRGLSSVKTETVAQMIVQQQSQRIVGLLSSALRARRIELGSDAVRSALLNGKGDLLVVAGDARGRADELKSAARAIGCATVSWGTKPTLGSWLGRDELAVLLITERGIARAVLECIEQVEALEASAEGE